MRALWVTLLVGCYSPHPQAGAACPSGACPDPLVCSPATQTCEVVAIDAARAMTDAPADGARDAMADARVMLDAPPPTAHLVQQETGHADADTLTITLAAAPAVGDVLIFVGADQHASLDPASGVIGGGVTQWSRATFSNDYTNIEIWYGAVTIAAIRGIVITGPAGATQPLFGNVSEWSGLATTSMLDGAHANSGLTSPADPLAITTTHADLVILGVGDAVPNTFGTPAPGTWVALTGIEADISLGAWYHLAGPTTVHSTVTETANEWDAAVAALKIAP